MRAIVFLVLLGVVQAAPVAKAAPLAAKKVAGSVKMSVEQQRTMHSGCVSACKPSPVESKCVTACEAAMYKCIDETGPNETPKDTKKCQDGVLKLYQDTKGVEKKEEKKDEGKKEEKKAEKKKAKSFLQIVDDAEDGSDFEETHDDDDTIESDETESTESNEEVEDGSETDSAGEDEGESEADEEEESTSSDAEDEESATSDEETAEEGSDETEADEASEEGSEESSEDDSAGDEDESFLQTSRRSDDDDDTEADETTEENSDAGSSDGTEEEVAAEESAAGGADGDETEEADEADAESLVQTGAAQPAAGDMDSEEVAEPAVGDMDSEEAADAADQAARKPADDEESFVQTGSSWKPEHGSGVHLYEHPQGSTLVTPCPVESQTNTESCGAYFAGKADGQKCAQLTCSKAMGVTMKLTCNGGCCPTCWAPDHVIAVDRHTSISDAAVVDAAPQAAGSCGGVKCFKLACAPGFSEGFVNGACCYSCVQGR